LCRGIRPDRKREITMRVQVDESRHDVLARSIDRRLSVPHKRAEGGDPAVFNSDIRNDRAPARAVYDASSLDYKVEHCYPGIRRVDERDAVNRGALASVRGRSPRSARSLTRTWVLERGTGDRGYGARLSAVKNLSCADDSGRRPPWPLARRLHLRDAGADAHGVRRTGGPDEEF